MEEEHKAGKTSADEATKDAGKFEKFRTIPSTMVETMNVGLIW